jgi:hypothetical protein
MFGKSDRVARTRLGFTRLVARVAMA